MWSNHAHISGLFSQAKRRRQVAAANPSDFPLLVLWHGPMAGPEEADCDPFALQGDPSSCDHLIPLACLQDLSGSPSIQLQKQTQ